MTATDPIRDTETSMRRLLLLRHAKTERPVFGGDDRDRKLTARGHNDAPKIAAYMARHALIPDRAIVSPARRTRETWDLVATGLRPAPRVIYDERLYDATPQAILEIIKECGRNVTSLLVIGHNPGLHETATLLVATGEADVRQRLNEKFPTSALAVIDFALDDWSRLHAQAGRLDHFVSPKLLTPATD
jgi:phosphohistidine phosphatase